MSVMRNVSSSFSNGVPLNKTSKIWKKKHILVYVCMLGVGCCIYTYLFSEKSTFLGNKTSIQDENKRPRGHDGLLHNLPDNTKLGLCKQFKTLLLLRFPRPNLLVVPTKVVWRFLIFLWNVFFVFVDMKPHGCENVKNHSYIYQILSTILFLKVPNGGQNKICLRPFEVLNLIKAIEHLNLTL